VGNQSPPVTAIWVDPFVAAYQLDDTFPCLAVIEEAELTNLWKPSLSGHGDKFDYHPEHRDSDQIMFSIDPVSPGHIPLLDFASGCLDHYLASLPQASRFSAFRVAECYNLIRYKPGQAYHYVHADYFPFKAPYSTRHLSFVLFLNTVEDGGELEFPQQNLFVKPEEGKGIIFPSGWTHAHHTLPPVTETRYVIQLWWSFIEEVE
jgi:hypothetical protein